MSAMRWKSASASSTVFPAVGQCGTCVSINAGGHRGYMERPYLNRGGGTYVQRTYYVGGRSYVYAYRTYYYGGAPYYGYALLPARLLRMGLQPLACTRLLPLGLLQRSLVRQLQLLLSAVSRLSFCVPLAHRLHPL